jgi:hypothetical protein
MNLVKTATICATAFALTACGGGKNVKDHPQIQSGITVTSINIPAEASVVEASPGAINRRAISECSLPTQFSTLLTKSLQAENITVHPVAKLNTAAKGYNLTAEFTNIINTGNPFIGQSKYTPLHITLYKNGHKVSQAYAGRKSNGGFMGGFKGSCAVLGRTVKANAKDISKWLKNPVNGARLGDM